MRLDGLELRMDVLEKRNYVLEKMTEKITEQKLCKHEEIDVRIEKDGTLWQAVCIACGKVFSPKSSLSGSDCSMNRIWSAKRIYKDFV